MRSEARNPKRQQPAPGSPSRLPSDAARCPSELGLQISFGLQTSDFGLLSRSRCRAYLLIDCLVYIALLLVLLALAFMTFYKTLEASKALNRNAADTARALNAGERWRADVRAATAPLRLEQAGAEAVLHLPRNGGEILYAFREGAVLRKNTTGGGSDWEPFLSEVKASRMFADPRHRVTAYRWELELAPGGDAKRVRPLFTFHAVPAYPQKP